jgi:hypothetical protein
MMDVYCPRCGEPMDPDEFHDVSDLTYQQAQRKFFSEGCGMLFNGKPCEERKSLRTEASTILAELLGDDVDGIAAMMEDFEFAGMLED